MYIKAAALAAILAALGVVVAFNGQQTAPPRKEPSVQIDKTLEGQVNAPDFPSHLTWLNTNRKLSLRDFRGKFVLLDFWTFCCINCMHVIPDLKKLEAKYPEELVVIGVHSAKFANEKDTGQIRQAILRYGIRHPVVNDSDFEVWRSYAANAWPTLVLINPNGRIVGQHSGEGIFGPFDAVISSGIRYFDAKGQLKRSRAEFALEEARRPDTLLSFPGKVSSDPARARLFVSDSNHNRILVTDPHGAVLDVIGSGEEGLEDGPFESAALNHPQGTAIDGDLLYIADTENHAVRIADLAARRVTTLLGTGSQARSFNAAGTGTQVALSSPWDVLVNGGKLYIAMAGTHQLWVADLKTRYAQPFAGSGREGRMDGSRAEAALAQPSGLATDGASLFFADSETSSVRSVDLAGMGPVRTLIGEDLFVFGDVDGARTMARLQHPLGVLYHGGKLFVADTYNSKIKVVDPLKESSVTLSGKGKAGYRDGKLAAAEFNEPGGLAALGERIYVADTNNHQVRVIDTKAGTVGTLEFTNLDRLARRQVSRFRGRQVRLEEQALGPGKVTIKLGLTLPAGYKLSRGAPFYIEWRSGDPHAVRFDAASKDFDLREPVFPLEVPVTAAAGSADVTVDAAVYYCTEKSTACYVDTVRITAPVRVASGGPASVAVSVPVKTPNPML